MSKISLIGDCHASRILTSHLVSNNNIDFTVWSRGGLRLTYKDNIGFDPSILYDNNSMSDNIEKPINDDYTKNYSIPFSKIKDEGVIIVWIGYCDIKYTLPIENNSFKIIENTLINLKKFFKKSTILFAEPFPQFYNFHMPSNENHIKHSYHKRVKQNIVFIENLNLLLKKYNLSNPISQNEIIECTNIKNFNELVMESTGIDKFGNLLYERDAILPEYYDLIYQLFIEKANEYNK